MHENNSPQKPKKNRHSELGSEFLGRKRVLF